MTTEPIILVARLRYAVAGQVRVLGLSDSALYRGRDPAVYQGVYWPLIDPSRPVRWSEQARHIFHDQPPPLEIGSITLVNRDGFFDHWLNTDTIVTGFRTEIRRGPPGTDWDDLEPVLVARNETLDFQGRQSVILELGNVLKPLQSVWNKQVFDPSIANPQLAGTTAQAVLGRALSVAGHEIDPQNLRYTGAWNLADVDQVAEGGNPDVNWDLIELGWQLNQMPTLGITADIVGPPLADVEATDILATRNGDFSEWSGSPSTPDGITLDHDPPDAEFSEDAGGGLVDIDVSAIDFEETVNPGSSARADIATITGETDRVPLIALDDSDDPLITAATWWQFLDTDDGSRVIAQWDQPAFNQGRNRAQGLDVGAFFTAIDPSVQISGVEIRVDAERTAQHVSTGQVLFEEVRLVSPTGGQGVNLAGDTPMPSSRGWVTFGSPTETGGLALDAATLSDPDLRVRIRLRHSADLTVSDPNLWQLRGEIHRVEVILHIAESASVIRLSWTDALEPGDRYRIRIKPGQTAQQVTARFGGTDTAGGLIATDPADSYSTNSVRLIDDEWIEARFIAGGPVFTLGFAARDTDTGGQLIEQVELVNISAAVDRLTGLARYIVAQSGLDPDEHVATEEFEALAEFAGDPLLGWLTRQGETGDDLLFLLAGSCGGAVYHGRDGKVHCFPIRPAADIDDTLPEVGPERIDTDRARIWDDDPPGITDRAKGARNWDPVPADRAAGITSTWTASDRARAIADWRITRRARFDDLQGFEPPAAPELSIISIDPTTGDPAGGTEVTITGTGFEPGATVTFGGEPATNVVVVNSTTITCETPPEPE